MPEIGTASEPGQQREGSSAQRATVAEIATFVGGRVIGDGEAVVSTVNSLAEAGTGELTFYSDKRHRKHLPRTRATAVLLGADDADACPVTAIVTANPYAAYARAAALLHPQHRYDPGVHPTAAVDPTAEIDPAAWIGPCAVVETGARIASGVQVGPGCVIGREVSIGRDSILLANVTVCAGCVLGERALIHPGAVIGSDGFGQAPEDGKWVKIPQIGRVVVGDDVEIGANTTIDRGAIGETVIEDGVRIDNLVQVGHNVRVGAHTAMAALVGISGSTTIGKHCMLGGEAGVGGHLTLTDGVIIGGGAAVRQSIDEPGAYASGGPLEPIRSWYRNSARIRELNEIAKRLRRLEKRVAESDD